MAGAFDKLPAILRLAADTAGMQAAVGLVDALGGKFVYIPRRAAADHPLSLAGGRAAAAAITKEFGGMMVYMPNGRAAVQRVAAAQALADGKSFNEAVEISGLHYRSVQRVAREMREGASPMLMAQQIRTKPKADPRQIDIEDWLKAQSS